MKKCIKKTHQEDRKIYQADFPIYFNLIRNSNYIIIFQKAS